MVVVVVVVVVVVSALKGSESGMNVVAWKAGTFVHLPIRPIRTSVTEHVTIECLAYTKAISKNKGIMVLAFMDLLESSEGDTGTGIDI